MRTIHKSNRDSGGAAHKPRTREELRADEGYFSVSMVFANWEL